MPSPQVLQVVDPGLEVALLCLSFQSATPGLSVFPLKENPPGERNQHPVAHHEFKLKKRFVDFPVCIEKFIIAFQSRWPGKSLLGIKSFLGLYGPDSV